VCRVLPGYAFKSKDWTTSGVPVVKIRNIREDNTVDLSDTDHVPADLLSPRLSKFVLNDGDILLAMTGATAGKVGRVRTTKPLLLNQRVAKVVPEQIDPLFVWAVVSSRQYQEMFYRLADGAAQPNMSGGQIESVQIPFPPKRAQRRIASILSAYDDLIENNTRRIAILEEMARRIYEEWFVRFRFPGHEGVRMVDSDLGCVPEGWLVQKLEDLATVTMGLSPKGDTYNDAGDGVPLINGPVEFGEKLTKRVKWTTSPTKFCAEGDLVVCVRGSTTGKYVKSDGSYCLGRGVCAIHSRYQSFVDRFFIHTLPSLLAQTGGSTFPSWTGPQLKSHRLLMPFQDLLVKFEEVTQPMSRAVLVYSRMNQNLRTTRDLLLPKLISGELHVSEVSIPEAVAA
jgi:type I restriction enzyme S subunit